MVFTFKEVCKLLFKQSWLQLIQILSLFKRTKYSRSNSPPPKMFSSSLVTMNRMEFFTTIIDRVLFNI